VNPPIHPKKGHLIRGSMGSRPPGVSDRTSGGQIYPPDAGRKLGGAVPGDNIVKGGLAWGKGERICRAHVPVEGCRGRSGCVSCMTGTLASWRPCVVAQIGSNIRGCTAALLGISTYKD
jgi:hypothetical protein